MYCMTHKRIGKSIDGFSFYSSLLASSLFFVCLFVCFAWVSLFGWLLGLFFGMSVCPFYFMLFHFLLFLCLATVRVDMSETPNT